MSDALGLLLPPFTGPLVAFDPAEGRSCGDPVCLGGDLHAVHPESRSPPPVERDASLDAATITLSDFEHEAIEATAVDGIWCIAIRGDALHSAPYLAIFDTDGRLRVWSLLPSAPLLIGSSHHWLPRIPSA